MSVVNDIYQPCSLLSFSSLSLWSKSPKSLSIEKQKELNIYKEPNKIKETTLKDRHSTLFELGESISKLETGYQSSKSIGKDAWVTINKVIKQNIITLKL